MSDDDDFDDLEDGESIPDTLPGSLIGGELSREAGLPPITSTHAAAIIVQGPEAAIRRAKEALQNLEEQLPRQEVARVLSQASKLHAAELRLRVARGGDVSTDELEGVLLHEGLRAMAGSGKDRDAGRKLLLELHKRRHQETLARVVRAARPSPGSSARTAQTM